MPLGTQTGGAEGILLNFLEHGQTEDLSCVVFFLTGGPLVRRARELGADVRVVDAGRLRHLRRYSATVGRLTRLLLDGEGSPLRKSGGERGTSPVRLSPTRFSLPLVLDGPAG
jgi:hypothetical protein